MTILYRPRLHQPERSGPDFTAACVVFRILIVGDCCDGIRGLRDSLRWRGHPVECANTGAAALQLAHAFQPEFVLIDASLPDLSGFEIAALLPAVIRSGQLRIVSVSMGGEEESCALSRAAGCVSHLRKPVDFLEIEELLAGCGARMESYFRMNRPGTADNALGER